MNLVGIAYVSGFAVTGTVCLAAIFRARNVDNADVRRGLVGLLATTGVWALLKAAYFTLPGPLREPTYTVGLIFGFGTVWAWLYFCSAYTGRRYHHNGTLRQLGAGVFLTVAVVKVTNPIHGQYFSTDEVTTPFAHLAIEHEIFHWGATGLSYALAAVGMFMLFEYYFESSYDTRPLGVLTVLIGLPIAFDVTALLTPTLVDVIYAPIGVAIFVLGALFVYERRFLAVQDTGDDDALVFLDDGRVRDYSAGAVALFPELEGALGTPITEVLPAVTEALEADEQIVERTDDGDRRYYLVSDNTVALGDSSARVLVFSDVTDAERRRRELRRHNDQLAGLAGALTHELRNMLQIVRGRLDLVAERADDGTVEYESLEAAAEASDRMAELVDDFTMLARYGQTIEDLETVEFRSEVEGAWTHTPTGDLDLIVESDGTLQAESQRLQQLLSNAFTFARLNDAETVAVRLCEDGFTITDDGRPPTEDIEGYFAFGESVPDAESGMKLPNVRSFARVLGWNADIDTDYEDGVRIVIGGATTSVAEQTTPQVDAN